jgi:hypothetical protein
MQLTAKKAQKIASENAILKAQLRTAKRLIRDLRKEIGRSAGISLDSEDMAVLHAVADCDAENGYAVDLAEILGFASARLDYHLQKLVDGSYVDVLFTDPALGACFGITQKGRRSLVKRHLI